MSRAELPHLALGWAERFEVTRNLGGGGHGVVYEAIDKQRKQLVAIKVLRDASAEGIYRFKQEFRTLADIHHPNLARLDELFSSGPNWFFTMELVDGVDFLRHARPESSREGDGSERSRGFDEARLRSALRQLVQGVLALHGAGKLHRDLKPANVLVTGAGRVVILDFGVSAELSEVERSMSLRIAGTPSYMAPEQVEGGRPSESSDWYSLGVMLFEALTGKNPFDGPLLDSLLLKRTGTKPPSFFCEGVPADLDRLCWDLLAPKADERPRGVEILVRLGGAGSSRSEAQPRVHHRLVGRDAELATLERAFQLHLEGKPVVVRVHGESGVGKSALVAQFVEQLARDASVLVLSGRCYERESMPYKALDGLIDVLSQRLRRMPNKEVEELRPADSTALLRLFPVLGRVDAFAAAPRDPYVGAQDALVLRRRAWTAFRELFERLSRRGPIVLVLDDLQWGDEGSVELLAPLMLGPAALPVLLVAGYRRRESVGGAFASMLDQLRAGGVHGVDVPLEPLSPDVARSLATQLIGGLDAGRLDQIVREAAGNPFLLEQFSRHAASGHLRAGSGLRDLIELQLERVPPEARMLLELLTVAGGPVETEWLRRAVEPEKAGEALQALHDAQLVRDMKPGEHEAVDTYHDRIREALRAALSDVEKRALHARLAELIESSTEPDAEILATQLEGAGLPRRAAQWAARAADEALEALAFERATRLYRRALELDPENEKALLHCWTGLGESLSGESKGALAAAALLEAARLSSEGALDLRRRAAEQLLRCGQIDRGTEVMKEVLESVGFHLPATQFGALISFLWRRALVKIRGLSYRRRTAIEIEPATLARLDVCWTATLGLGLVDPIRAASFHSRQLQIALDAGEPYRLARALASEVGYGGMGGRSAQAHTELITRRARELADEIGHPHAIGLAHFFGGTGAWLVGKWRECRDSCIVAETVLRERCRGVAWEIANSQMFRLSGCMWMGELEEHRRLLPEFLREARERDDLYAVTTLTLLTYSHVPRLAADDPESALELTAEALSGWSQSGFHLHHLWALFARIEIELYRGNARAAREELDRQWQPMSRSHLLRVQSVRSFVHHLSGRVAVALANEGKLGDARRMVRRIRGEGLDWSTGLAELLVGGIATASAGPEESARALERGEALLRASDMGLHAAAARRRRGELAGGEAGRELVASADAWMNERGVVRPERFAALLVPLALAVKK